MSEPKLFTAADVEWLERETDPRDIIRILRERGLIAPSPVDPLLVEAREILAARAATTEGAQGWRTGKWDGEHEMLCTLAALRRGMELAPAARPLTREVVREALEADGWIFRPPADRALFDRLHAALTEGQSK